MRQPGANLWRRQRDDMAARCDLWLAHARTLLAEAFRTDVDSRVQSDLAVLEDRILLSATPIVELAEMAGLDAPASDVESAQGEPTALVSGDPLVTSQQDDLRVSEQGSVESPPTELLVIDPDLPDADRLLADIESRVDRAVRTLVLDNESDAIDQISAALESMENVHAVHLVAHGDSGMVQLAGTSLRAGQLDAYANQFADWGNALTEDADLLVYGCDVAGSVEGRAMLNEWGSLTGADVAGSTDLTGHNSLGGDWDLEYTTGQIDAVTAFSAQLQQQWRFSLETVTVTQTADIVNGSVGTLDELKADDGGDGISLREAILAANETEVRDTILLGPGTYQLTIGSGDDNADKGDLDLKEDVIIQGAGPGVTVVDASGLIGGDRVFDIRGAAVTIEGVTITGGSGEEGSGILVDHSATLTLNDVVVSGNDADGKNGGGIANKNGTLFLTDVTLADNHSGGGDGGGLYSKGHAVLNRVTVTGNSAGRGGGIYTEASDALSLVNVTISGNAATDEGGGLYAKDRVDILHSTIAYNTAPSGGGIEQAGGPVNLKNSILADNVFSDGVTPSNVQGVIVSQGYNVDSDGTAALAAVGDQSNIDPGLSATLADRGGKVATHALSAGSPAIDVSGLTGSPAVDQRNIVRDATPDVGAFEFVSTELETVDERLVHTASADVQETSSKNRGSTQAVAMADDGSYVIVWSQQDKSTMNWDVMARRFDRFAQPLGDTFQVNQQIANDQRWANVAMDAAGNFVVTWTSEGQDGDGQGVYARRFNDAGTPVSDEFRVNQTTTGDQRLSMVSMNRETGDFAIVWSHDSLLNKCLLGRRYDADGNPVGPSEFAITNDGLAAIDPVVAMHGDGQLVVAWEKSGDIHWKRYDAAWNSLRGDVAAENNLLVTAEGPAVAFLNDGSIVLAWSQDADVMLRRYRDDGTPVAAAEVANTTTTATQQSPSLTAYEDGSFTVVWEGKGSDDPKGIYLQKFNSDGSRNGSETRVNTTTSSQQVMASLAGVNADNFVVAWSGTGADDADGVYARQFGTAASIPPAVNSSQSFQVIEHAANGTAVGTVQASDPDSPPSTFVWTIVGGNAGGGFAIDASTGEISVADSSQLDYSAADTHTLEIAVSDGSSSSSVESVEIEVGSAAPTDIALSDLTVVGQTPGAVVGTLSSADITASESHAYTVDDARFEVIAGQLRLKATKVVDYASEPAVSLQVVTTDTAGNSFAKSFVLTVLSPPVVQDAQVFEVMEWSPNGTLIGVLQATDLDSPATSLNWAIASGNSAGIFSLNAATGQLTVADSAKFSYSTVTGHDLVVTVSDGATTSAAETVRVNLLNAPPTDITLSRTELTGSTVGAVVGTLASSDPTTVDSYTYSVDDVRFEVAGSQLRLKADQMVSYASEPTVTLQVETTDSAGNTFTESFVATVLSRPMVSSSQTFDVMEWSADGTLIGSVQATDLDGSPLPLSFAIIGGNSSGIFTIDAATGEITVADASQLSFTAASQHDLIVTVSDGNSTSVAETVAIEVKNAPPTDVTLDRAAVTGSTAGAVVGTLTSSDPTTVDSHTYSVDDARFEVKKDRLRLKPGERIVHAGEPGVQLQVTSNDSAGNSFTQSLEIDVLNNAPIARGESLTLNELAPVIIQPASLLANDIDIDGDSLAIELVAGPAHGSVEILADGSLKYTPDNAGSAVDSLRYRVYDGFAYSQPVSTTLSFPVSTQGMPGSAGAPASPGSGSPEASSPVAESTSTDSAQEQQAESKADSDEAEKIQRLAGSQASRALVGAQLGGVGHREEAASDLGIGEAWAGEAAASGPDTRTVAATIDLSSTFATSAASAEVERDMRETREQQATEIEPLKGTMNPVQQALLQPQLWQAIDSMNQELQQSVAATPLRVGATATTTAGITAGYVVWVLRSGLLMSSAFAHLPMWRFMDPLTVLHSRGPEEDDDSESLHSIVAEENAENVEGSEESQPQGRSV